MDDNQPDCVSDMAEVPRNESLQDVIELMSREVERLQASLDFYRTSQRSDREELVRWYVMQIDLRQDKLDELRQMKQAQEKAHDG